MILSGLFTSLVVLFVSCSKKDGHFVPDPTIKQSLQKMIDSGDLLNNVKEESDNYIFNFESGTLSVPKAQIAEIVALPQNWKTVLTFNDKSQLAVPSIGTSLDFIVEKIDLNPSGYNPLAAMAHLNLPTYGRVRVTVHGKDGNSGTITHLFKNETIRQDIPVFGLYPDYDNLVDFTFTDKDGKERGTTQVHIRTEALSIQDFPGINVIKTQPERMEPGVNLVSFPGKSEVDLSMPYIIDNEGQIRWILLLKSSPDLNKLSASIGLKRTKKGTFILGDQYTPRIIEIDMFGDVLHQWDIGKLGYTFHHEITESEDGHYLVTVTKSSARLTNGQPRVNDHIIEFDPVSGSVVKEWDLADIVDTARYLKPDGITPPAFSQSPNNWAHNNSIKEMNGNLLATMRYQGIVNFSQSGKLRWLISPHRYWGEKYKPYLLNPVDRSGNLITDTSVINGNASTEDFDWSWGPHTPCVLSNDRILVFDNGYNRNWIPNAIASVNYSRVVEYKVDETNKTVQEVWSYGKSRGNQVFSEALSGVQYLSKTGHILFCPGMGVPTAKGRGGRIMEIDPTTNEVIFETEITAPGTTAFHRITRMPLYPDNF